MKTVVRDVERRVAKLPGVEGADGLRFTPADLHRTGLDIVRDVFPDATDDEAAYLLWNETGYPAFWQTKWPAEEIRAQMRRLQRNKARRERRTKRREARG